MKATGEVMSIDRSYEAALMKAIRSMEVGMHSLRHKNANLWSVMEIEEKIKRPNDERLFVIAEGFRRGMMIEEIQELSNIDPWFLRGIERLVNMELEIREADYLHQLHRREPMLPILTRPAAPPPSSRARRSSDSRTGSSRSLLDSTR